MSAQVRSARRVSAARRVAMVVAQALETRATATGPQLGARLNVSATRALKVMRGEAPWHLGDLLLLHTGDALSVLDAIRAAVMEHGASLPVDRRVRRTSIRVGELAARVDDALADGRIEAHEAAGIRSAALSVASEALATVGEMQLRLANPNEEPRSVAETPAPQARRDA